MVGGCWTKSTTGREIDVRYVIELTSGGDVEIDATTLSLDDTGALIATTSGPMPALVLNPRAWTLARCSSLEWRRSTPPTPEAKRPNIIPVCQPDI